MQERIKVEEEDRERTDWLTELMRSSARELIAAALKTEVDELVASYAEQRDERVEPWWSAMAIIRHERFRQGSGR